MPQETKAHPFNAESAETVPGFAHENLEGQIPSIATDDEIRAALEKAFDYRGDVTITRKDGTIVEGYIFDRRSNGKTLADCAVRLFPKDRDEKISIPLQRHRPPRIHRPRHRRRQELRNLGKKIPREKSRGRKEYPPRTRKIGLNTRALLWLSARTV